MGVDTTEHGEGHHVAHARPPWWICRHFSTHGVVRPKADEYILATSRFTIGRWRAPRRARPPRGHRPGSVHQVACTFLPLAALDGAWARALPRPPTCIASSLFFFSAVAQSLSPRPRSPCCPLDVTFGPRFPGYAQTPPAPAGLSLVERCAEAVSDYSRWVKDNRAITRLPLSLLVSIWVSLSLSLSLLPLSLRMVPVRVPHLCSRHPPSSLPPPPPPPLFPKDNPEVAKSALW